MIPKQEPMKPHRDIAINTVKVNSQRFEKVEHGMITLPFWWLHCHEYACQNTKERQMSDRFLYIAGPMSGIEDYNRSEFEKAALHVKETFHIPASNIFNPIDHEASLMVQEGKLHGPDAYRICLKMDLDWICDWATDMYMLSGWINSKGANTEHALAVALNLNIHYQQYR